MAINSAAGSKLYVGPALGTTDTLTEFEGLSWTEVGEVEDMGQFGDQSASITFSSLSDNRVRKLKGPKDAGDMAVVCGADSSDTGQQAMLAAEGSQLDFAFKVVENDAATPSGEGTTSYFGGKVMSKRKNVGNATNVVRYDFTIGISTGIIEVPKS